MATPKKTAAIYARFSSDMQKDRSIDDQHALCATYAQREGFRVVARFEDRAKSGASLFDRDGLLELRSAAKRREFDVVIVESLDRLSRDQEDLAGLFKRLEHYGVELRTVSEGVTTAIHVGVRGIVGSMFLTDLANKVRRGYLGRVREGKVPGKAAYGYRAIPNRPNEREIDPETAEVVRRIFREYASGMAPRSIALGLTRDGIAAPSGGAWSYQSFLGGGGKTGMLRNRLYVGQLIWNRTHTVRDPDTGRASGRPNPKDDHVAIAVPHLRIIDDELFAQVQAIRHERGQKSGCNGRVRARNQDHLLSGLLRCSRCGSTMILTTRSRGAPFVACATSRNTATCDHRKSYDVAKLERLVINGLRESLTDPAAVTAAASAYHERYRENEKRQSAERLTVEKRLSRVTVMIERLVSVIADTEEPVEEIMAKVRPLEAERVGLRERLRLLKSETVVTMHPNVMEQYRATVERLYTVIRSATPGRDAAMALRNIVDSVVVHETPERRPYEVSVYGRLAAIMGVDLFPTMRTASEIIEENGMLPAAIAANAGGQEQPYRSSGDAACRDSGKPGTSRATLSQQRNVILLGRFIGTSRHHAAAAA